MARYDSSSVNEPGQYPTTAWSNFGLPEQNFGSGAPGSSPTSSLDDVGDTNEPGQYPERETFTGVALGGTGAPGSQGVPVPSWSPGSGGDSVVYSQPTFYKGQRDAGTYNTDENAGNRESTARGSVSGEADWTQANDNSYGPGWNMPGVEGNTPTPGSGQFQTGAGNVMYGGRLNGTGHTSKHPSWSGPGT
jgi:hypothetical protein